MENFNNIWHTPDEMPTVNNMLSAGKYSPTIVCILRQGNGGTVFEGFYEMNTDDTITDRMTFDNRTTVRMKQDVLLWCYARDLGGFAEEVRK